MRTNIEVRVIRTARDGWVLRWRDDSGKRQRRCRGRNQRDRESERQQLEQHLNDRAAEVSWSEFWTMFETRHLDAKGRSASHRAKCRMMHARLQEAAERQRISDFRCSDISKRLILEVESDLHARDVEESTIASHMSTLWSLISWGQEWEVINDFRRPRKRMGKAEKQRTKSKGRSLTLEEVERMEAAVPLVCKDFETPAEYTRAMAAMRLIGMRLTECWLFSWEPGDGVHYPVRLDRSTAAIQFANVQKSGIDSEVPLTDEALAWLRSLPQSGRWVCRTIGAKGPHKTPGRLGRVISEAGQRANVVVKRFRKASGEKIKYASAHDLRRTFATSLAAYGLDDKEKIKLTRHADVQVLLDNYVDAPTPVLVSKLRGLR